MENDEKPKKTKVKTANELYLSGDVSAVVRAPSEVTIEQEGKKRTLKFDPNYTSGDIATASTSDISSQLLPPNFKNLVINNINAIEQFSDQGPLVETEHSFEINLKIFKYRYTRKIAKK